MNACDFLKRLISFSSVSAVSNADVSDYAESVLNELGFETERLTYVDRAGVDKVCVCARKGPSGRGLAYFCHTDVVPVSSWSYPQGGPWDAHQTQDRIYGRGACDMKGSLACMLEAAARVPNVNQPLFIVCTADEETGYAGANHVVRHSRIYREIVESGTPGIIGEPTCLDVVYAHKGGRAGRIMSTGRASHSSTTEGINANLAMIPFLAELRDMCLACDRDPAWRDDRFDPPTITMNIGINDFTPAVNITPARSVCTYLFRPMPNQDADGLVDRIRRSAESHGLSWEQYMTGEPVFTDPESPFIRALAKLTGSAPHTVAYGTDGACFGEIRELAVIGPGDIRQAHTDDEWISLKQVAAGVDFYESAIRHWCMVGDRM